jgi:hypothetical protein
VKTYSANANNSRETCGIFRSLSGGLFTKLCGHFQKLADRSYVSPKPNFSLALQRVFSDVQMGNSDSTQAADVGDTVDTGDRVL